MTVTGAGVHPGSVVEPLRWRPLAREPQCKDQAKMGISYHPVRPTARAFLRAKAGRTEWLLLAERDATDLFGS